MRSTAVNAPAHVRVENLDTGTNESTAMPALAEVPVGPPPPRDPECAAGVARIPPMPPLTLESIPTMRVPPPGFGPPSDEQLARNGVFTLEECLAPGTGDAPDIPLLVCRPASAVGLRPAIYYIHGGGMVTGERRMGLEPILDWAERLSLVVVSVEYRLAPESPYPGPVEDCDAGLRWTIDNAYDLGIDENRMIVAGSSAGGGLAASLALMVRERGDCRPVGLMLMAPMLDDRNDSPSVLQMTGVDTWDRARNAVGWGALLGSARGTPDVSPYAAAARATELSGLPSTFLDVGSADSFRDEVVDFAVRIWRVGGSAELHVWPGGFHGYSDIVPEAAISKETQEARIRWLQRLLPDPDPGSAPVSNEDL
jgi:acetyl esterase/lipase